MSKSKPEQKFRHFISDDSIPGGIRVLILTYIILAFYFFIISVFLFTFIHLRQIEVHFGLILVSGYSLASSIFLFLSIYPLWSAKFFPRFWAVLVSVILVGYSFLWLYAELDFVFLSFLFLLIGVIGGLFVMTGSNPKQYYRKDQIYTNFS